MKFPTPQEIQSSVEASISRLTPKDREDLTTAMKHSAFVVARATQGQSVSLEEVVSLRDMVAPIMSAISCCSKGCGHCCKMAVTITSGEAQRIGARIGVVPKNPPPEFDQARVIEKYMGTVCPFLKNNVCSIYEHRPEACRTHFNISAYPIICDVINHPGHDIPSLDVQELWLAESAVAALSGEYPADIRDFFPDGLSSVESL